MDDNRKVEFGIAEYLDQFDKSPYSYPANGFKVVEGALSLKGSWFQKKK